jgi:hypothetical protein
MEGKDPNNIGMYLAHCQFYIGGKLYLVNPAGVRTVCYDLHEKEITFEFNHPGSNLKYYCFDEQRHDWDKISLDFIKSWNTKSINIIERCIAKFKERRERRKVVEKGLYNEFRKKTTPQEIWEICKKAGLIR